jgi:hypothetical protein
MIHFMAWQIGLALVKLKDIEQGALNQCTFLPNRDAVLPHDYAQNLSGYVRYARKRFEFVELGQAVLRSTDNFIRDLGQNPTYDRVANNCRFLLEAVESELKMRRFAFVPVVRAAKLDNIDNDWGDVQAKFPLARDDIRDAVECYALDKHTACIFHLMRVSEYGLRYFSAPTASQVDR